MPAQVVNKDLQNDRSKCTFNQEEFTVWWVGGEEKLKEKRSLGEHIRCSGVARGVR